MPLSLRQIEGRAVKTGIKTSKKRGHVVSEEELLSLRVQRMPPALRIFLGLLGAGLVASAWFAWPSDSGVARVIEGLSGIFSIAFGIFGIRRTLSGVFDSANAGDLASGIVELIGEAISGIDLF